MKKLLFFAPFAALLVSGCQHPATQATSTGAAVAAPETGVAAPVPAATPVSGAAPELTAEMKEFLTKYEVGKLLLRDDGALNGFIGPDHYRTEVYFTAVTRDDSLPNRYRVQGKSRYKKQIIPLSGYLTITQLQGQPRVTKQEQQAARGMNSYENLSNAYSALGTFQLAEDSTARGAGVYQGELVVDFAVGEKGGLLIHTQSPQSLSRNAGIKLEGTWTSNATRQQKPVVWVYYIWQYGEAVLKNFNVGERGPEINHRYAKLGWDEFWENDEWWAEPGQLIASEPETTNEEDTTTVAGTSL